MWVVRARFGGALLALGLWCTACGGGERPRHHAATTETEPAPPPTTTSAAHADAQPAREVSFTTSDGVTIHGTLRPGAQPDAPAVVLVHQLASTRAEWAPLIDRLALERSLTTLAIDMRGHGESTVGPSGPLDATTFDAAAWAGTRLDVVAAVAWLASDASGVHPRAFAGVGSSIGASAVVAAAAEEPRLGTLVLLSPGRAYHGFDAIGPAGQLQSPSILAIVAREETDNVNTAQFFARLGGTEPMIVEGDAHGVLLFAAAPRTLDRAEELLRTQLEAPREGDLPPGSIPAPPITSAGTPVPPPT